MLGVGEAAAQIPLLLREAAANRLKRVPILVLFFPSWTTTMLQNGAYQLL